MKQQQQKALFFTSNYCANTIGLIVLPLIQNINCKKTNGEKT